MRRRGKEEGEREGVGRKYEGRKKTCKKWGWEKKVYEGKNEEEEVEKRSSAG